MAPASAATAMAASPVAAHRFSAVSSADRRPGPSAREGAGCPPGDRVKVSEPIGRIAGWLILDRPFVGVLTPQAQTGRPAVTRAEAPWRRRKGLRVSALLDLSTRRTQPHDAVRELSALKGDYGGAVADGADDEPATALRALPRSDQPHARYHERAVQPAEGGAPAQSRNRPDSQRAARLVGLQGP